MERGLEVDTPSVLTPSVLHAAEAASRSANHRRALERVVVLVWVFADTPSRFAVIPTFEAVVGTGAAKGRGSADRSIAALDSLGLAGAVPKALVDGALPEDASVSVRARRTVGEAPAAIREPSWGRTFVLGARVGRLAALTIDARFLAATLVATVGVAVDAWRACALVVVADELTETATAEDRLFLAAAAGWNWATLGPAPVAGAGVLLAAADEVLAVRAADGSLGAAPALDRPLTPVG
jgi:hypothetical protein